MTLCMMVWYATSWSTSLLGTNWGSIWGGFTTPYTLIYVLCSMIYQSPILLMTVIALSVIQGGVEKKMNSYNGAIKCSHILWYLVWYLCSQITLQYTWIAGSTGFQIHPILGYLWATHMISRSYEDMWKLGNVPGWDPFTTKITTMRFPDIMSSQFSDIHLSVQ